MNKKTFISEENFEIESRLIQFNIKPLASINDLSDFEKEEFFGKPIELNFSIEKALEMSR